MSSITRSNETIHGIVRRVKRRSSPFLTETQVKLRLGTVVGLGVKHPEVGASRWAWRSIGNLFGAVSFPVPSPRHSASLPVLRKNQLTSPFFMDLGEKEPSTSWEARHQGCGLMRRPGGAEADTPELAAGTTGWCLTAPQAHAR